MRKPSLSQAAIHALLLEKWKGATGLAPLAEGEESQVYSFRSDNAAYVLRINATATGFEKDALAHLRFNKRTLPIPRVVEIGQIDQTHAYCISHRIPGVTLQDARPAITRKLLRPTAGTMNAIATSDLTGFSGFGPFDVHGAGSFPTWHSFLTRIRDHLFDCRIAIARHLETDRVLRIVDLFERLAVYCPEQRQLVHGDFGSNNVLTDGREITGVIDWSEALFGDPLYDVANIFFWRSWLDCMQQLATYFESRIADEPNLCKRLGCYQLRIGLSEVLENSIFGNTDRCLWAIARCETIASKQRS